ncbi:microtubule-associated serine/threonine-protein kinase 4-like, partial [Phyllobates terribilis]|uniref:microtubule-associated serine/threonine-protein kinase 4-like n=1 Tax=Phyllobates terribilis TaxID=111132 RepID=UPI003CCB2F82
MLGEITISNPLKCNANSQVPAEERSQYGDLAFIKDLAEKVLCVLERPARSLERLETAEGDTKDEQNLIPGLNSDLTTETTVLADADSRICEIPEIQESDGSVIKSLTPSRQPHKSDYGTSKLISSGSFGMGELEVTSWVFWSDPLILPDRQTESLSESDSDNAINSLPSSSPSS